ncbi:hypothetical protein Pint_23565 [Pistacia integerrima]|uniref:Uncharacterized protein n=1 Tax=Pistacia integerrima TaxID=434235 RepID=A0ACC0YIC9_9ROSI|nr:hypothetical protein Pint_23565 [Pistacia integerrima]
MFYNVFLIDSKKKREQKKKLKFQEEEDKGLVVGCTLASGGWRNHGHMCWQCRERQRIGGWPHFGSAL